MFSTNLTSFSWRRANTIQEQDSTIFGTHQKAQVPVLLVPEETPRVLPLLGEGATERGFVGNSQQGTETH